MTNLIKTGPTYNSGSKGDGRFTLKPDSVNNTQDAITKTITVTNSITGQKVTFTFTQSGKDIESSLTKSIIWNVPYTAGSKTLTVSTPTRLQIVKLSGSADFVQANTNIIAVGSSDVVFSYDQNGSTTARKRSDVYYFVDSTTNQPLTVEETGAILTLTINQAPGEVVHNVYTTIPALVFRADAFHTNALGEVEPLYLGYTQLTDSGMGEYKYGLSFVAEDTQDGYVPIVFGCVRESTGRSVSYGGSTRYVHIKGAEEIDSYSDYAQNSTDVYNLTFSYTPDEVTIPAGNTTMYPLGYFENTTNNLYVYNEAGTSRFVDQLQYGDSYNTLSQNAQTLTFIGVKDFSQGFNFSYTFGDRPYAAYGLSNLYASHLKSGTVSTAALVSASTTNDWITIGEGTRGSIGGCACTRIPISFTANTTGADRMGTIDFTVTALVEYENASNEPMYHNKTLASKIRIKQLADSSSAHTVTIQPASAESGIPNVGSVNYVATGIIDSAQPLYLEGYVDYNYRGSSSNVFVINDTFTVKDANGSICASTNIDADSVVVPGTIGQSVGYEKITKLVTNPGTNITIGPIEARRVIVQKNDYTIDSNISRYNSDQYYPSTEMYVYNETNPQQSAKFKQSASYGFVSDFGTPSVSVTVEQGTSSPDVVISGQTISDQQNTYEFTMNAKSSNQERSKTDLYTTTHMRTDINVTEVLESI